LPKANTSRSIKDYKLEQIIDQAGEELLQGWGNLLDANNWSKQQLEQDLTSSRQREIDTVNRENTTEDQSRLRSLLDES
jgi:hypothetical protein